MLVVVSVLAATCIFVLQPFSLSLPLFPSFHFLHVLISLNFFYSFFIFSDHICSFLRIEIKAFPLPKGKMRELHRTCVCPCEYVYVDFGWNRNAWLKMLLECIIFGAKKIIDQEVHIQPATKAPRAPRIFSLTQHIH